MTAEQGSNDWLAERMGKITASRLSCVLAGRQTAKRREYIEELALDLIGAPAFPQDQPWFRHGKEDEPSAIALLELKLGLEIRRVGFIQHPSIPYLGCSPDGLFDDDGVVGGIEVKAYRSVSTFLAAKKTMDNGGVPSIHKAQVQGNMWVTGHDHWLFCAYHDPKKQLYFRTVWRDDAYIAMLDEKVREFWEEVQEKVNENHTT